MDLLFSALRITLILLTCLIFAYSFYACLLISFGSTVKAHVEPSTQIDHPLVSILIAAKDEAEILPYTLRRLLELEYPRDRFEIIVVAGDEKTMKACSDMEGEVNLLRGFGHESKPSALNMALPILKGDLILLLDADSIMERNALREMVMWMISEDAVAVAGTPYPLNTFEGILPQLFMVECALWERITNAKGRLGLFVQAPGFLSLLRSSWVRELEGWSPDSLAEDNDLAVRILCRGGRIILAPVKVGVEAPAKLRWFINQRFRWYGGTLEVLKRRLKELGSLRLGERLDTATSLLSPVGVALLLPILISILILGELASAILLALSIIILAFTTSIIEKLPIRLRAKIIILSLPYLLLNSMIALAALLSMISGLRPGWTKTERSGAYLKTLKTEAVKTVSI